MLLEHALQHVVLRRNARSRLEFLYLRSDKWHERVPSVHEPDSDNRSERGQLDDRLWLLSSEVVLKRNEGDVLILYPVDYRLRDVVGTTDVIAKVIWLRADFTAFILFAFIATNEIEAS